MTTVAELRARGWVIPDGFAVGDIAAALEAAPQRLNARRQEAR